MRRIGPLLAIATLLLALTGCSRAVEGLARPDPLRAPVAFTDDGYGIRAGFDDAPVEVEIYTEPQCRHCADLQADFGDQLAHYIATGQLAVTYRPLTFLDTPPATYSAAVVNAMVEAASPGDGDAPATAGPQFQRFVTALWTHRGAAATPTEMADLARTAGIPGPQVRRIAEGAMAFDAAGASDANFGFLYDIDPVEPGTPTVYDLTHDEKLDVYDDAWLTSLLSS